MRGTAHLLAATAWLVFLIFGCNGIAGIEPGVLALCDDGTRIGESGCPAPGEGQGGSGGQGSEDVGAGPGCPSCPSRCGPPWQDEDPATGSCYLQEHAIRDWSSARQRCVDLGGDLAAINSPSELAFVGGLIDKSLWIGGKETEAKGAFAWSNGEPWEFASWKDSKPGEVKGKPGCVMLTVVSGALPWFEARGCGEKRGYLCELGKGH